MVCCRVLWQSRFLQQVEKVNLRDRSLARSLLKPRRCAFHRDFHFHAKSYQINRTEHKFFLFRRSFKE